ncbi:restriction endonuclease, partial [Spirochaetota bacterium]
ASQTDFLSICNSALMGNGYNVSSINMNTTGVLTAIAIDANFSKWRNAKSMNHLIKFRRDNEIVEIEEIRRTVDDMKDNNCQRGVYYHTGKFSRSVMDYANTRPIDLCSTDKLQEVLKNAYNANGKLKTEADMPPQV